MKKISLSKSKVLFLIFVTCPTGNTHDTCDSVMSSGTAASCAIGQLQLL